MTNRIHTIKIKNFKAFDDDEYEFKLEGKHLLLYGENGSGKSSLFWALYTLFQSSVPNKDTGKYFERFGKPESLLNAFVRSPSSYIKVSFEQNPSFFHTLDRSGLIPRAPAVSLIPLTNAASDFVSHRLLVSFYNYKNSEEINLFPVFEKDILPFVRTRAGENLGKVYSDIRTNELLVETRGQIHTMQPREPAFVKNQAVIRGFNKEIKSLIAGINLRATEFFRKHFDEGRETYEIHLDYSTPLKFQFEHEKKKVKVGTSSFSGVYSSFFRRYNSPVIRLLIKARQNGSYVDIPKPQSFLNEAKLTGIALSIRFAVLETRATVDESQFIALDDLLISLDMVHREPIIDLLLDEYAKNYQLLVLTHDFGFFSMFRRKIAQKGVNPSWEFQQMSVDESRGYERPATRRWETHYARARRHFAATDYGECGNQLRCEFEEQLINIIPVERRRGKKGGKITLLGPLLPKARAYFKEVGCDASLLDKIEVYKDNLLNAASHYNSTSNSYREELKRVFAVADEVSTIKSRVILAAKKTFFLTVKDESGARYVFTLLLARDIRTLKKSAADKESMLNTSLQIKRIQIDKDTGSGTSISDYDYDYDNKPMQQIYEAVCKYIEKEYNTKVKRHGDPLEAFSLRDGTPIRSLVEL